MKSLISLSIAVFALSGSADSNTLPFAPTSRVWVEGTSTVRSYTCRAARIDGSVALAQAQTAASVAAGTKAVLSGEAVVPVAALGCGNETMDDHMRRALKATEHRTIRFRLSEYDLAAPAAEKVAVQMRGRLTIAGQERPVTVQATAQQEADGSLRVRGSHTVRMPDYGVKPPTLMMGTLRVGENVTVHFDMVLGQ